MAIVSVQVVRFYLFYRFCLEYVFLKWPVLINNDMEKLFLSFVLIFVLLPDLEWAMEVCLLVDG
jgi:hypothetical protein